MDKGMLVSLTFNDLHGEWCQTHHDNLSHDHVWWLLSWSGSMSKMISCSKHFHSIPVSKTNYVEGRVHGGLCIAPLFDNCLLYESSFSWWVPSEYLKNTSVGWFRCFMCFWCDRNDFFKYIMPVRIGSFGAIQLVHLHLIDSPNGDSIPAWHWWSVRQLILLLVTTFAP